MGKVRAKQRKKSGRRPRPTGLPSVKETEEDMSLEPAPQPGIPVLEKVSAWLIYGVGKHRYVVEYSMVK